MYILTDILFDGKLIWAKELLRFMKDNDQFKEIPVIVMSAQGQMEQTTLEMGAVEFWKKPFWNAQEVQSRVAKVLG